MNEKRRLTPVELDRYSRQIALDELGFSGQERIRGSSVLVAGLGGLGSPVSMQLAGMGVGRLRIVDFDVVEASNLHRQYLYGSSSIGLPKAEVAARRLMDLNPDIVIEPLTLSINSRTAERIVWDVDVVVDGLDRMAPRYALNRACLKLGIPYIFAAAITTYGACSTIVPGRTACLECFQGGLDDERLERCAVVGVLPSVLGILASIESSEAIRLVVGLEPRLANSLLLCDVWNMNFEEIELRRSDACPACGLSTSPPLKEAEIIDLCARGGKRTFVLEQSDDLDIDLAALASALTERGFTIDMIGKLGIAVVSSSGVRATILESGVVIMEGARDEEEASALHRTLNLPTFHSARPVSAREDGR
ncbi:MAG: HesA/MoeB/ThiF family protein [Euryarchaeota archaeon]|nr:HesA/MoeB/ThiF family protein [Euryarchaeota archaeon]